jgi:mediator of RNA polymerase II transcription subunit 31
MLCCRYLKYPTCLYFLELLQYEHFRAELGKAPCAKFIDDQQILLWQHYTRRRSRLMEMAAQRAAALEGLHPNGQTNNSK